MFNWAGRPGGAGKAGGAALLVSLALTTACSSKPPENEADYVAHVAAARAQKDADFQKGSDPIPDNRKAELLPLVYFPIDPAYKVPAVLKRIDDPTIIDMPTSTGTTRRMRRRGTLEFSLKGQPLKLTAFVEVADPDHLFVAFNDLTSGTETYPAGRYLDLTPNATGNYELDFNRAYNPYCYYNAGYECPYPPAENRLKVPIRAGERIKLDR
ncbi:MAG TPA: DUF1684 domain-containing protein [Vicinamibacterales bacterium]|nr:DUF1684 domain-containing protein [Vicinamibacterales bacterium]